MFHAQSRALEESVTSNSIAAASESTWFPEDKSTGLAPTDLSSPSASVAIKSAAQSSTVSSVTPAKSTLEVTTIEGNPHCKAAVYLNSAKPVRWQAVANQPWITAVNSTGSAPEFAHFEINASELSAGEHHATVTFSSSTGPLFILPVKLSLDKCKVTWVRSDPASSKVYASSADSSQIPANAYLLEIDSASEKILHVEPLVSAPKAMTFHPGDHRVYVANDAQGSIEVFETPGLQPDGTTFSTPPSLARDASVTLITGPPGRLGIVSKSIGAILYNTVTGVRVNDFPLRTIGVYHPTQPYFYQIDSNSPVSVLRKYSIERDTFTQVNSSSPGDGAEGLGGLLITENGDGLFWAGSYFDSSLTTRWNIGAAIQSATGDGRLCFGDDDIFDTTSKTKILSMPVLKSPSAYNSTTGKLAAVNNGKLQFFSISPSMSLADAMPAPELAASLITPSSVSLKWQDRSYEKSFTLQYRKAGAVPWLTASENIAQNQTGFMVDDLQEYTSYEFRLQAVSPTGNSDWSPIFPVTTTYLTPPSITFNDVYYFENKVTVYFTKTGSFESVSVDRGPSPSGPWTWIPGYQFHTSFSDSLGAIGETIYYRLRLARGNVKAEDLIVSVTIPTPPPPVISAVDFPAVSSSSIKLHWSDFDSHQYQIERRRLDESGWSPLASVTTSERVPAFVQRNYTDNTVTAGTRYVYRITASNPWGETVTLAGSMVAANPAIVLQDDFDPDRDASQWSATSVTTSINGGKGFLSGKSLWFGHAGERSATTVPVNLLGGGILTFDFRQGNTAVDGATYWESTETSQKSVLLESSSDGGATWVTLNRFSSVTYWATYSWPVPAQPESASLMFRWRQLAHGGASMDTWALDNVKVIANARPGPFFATQPPPVVLAQAGNAASLSIVSNNPQVSYQWYHDDQLVPSAKGAAYSIPRASSTDAGVYFCRISDGIETIDSSKTTLGIIARAGADKPVKVDTGGSFTLGLKILPASLAGDHKLTFQWHREEENELPSAGTISGENTSTLVVSQAQIGAEGEYRCRVSYPGAPSLEAGPFSVDFRPVPYVAQVGTVSFMVGNPVLVQLDVSDPNAVTTVTGLPPGLRFDGKTLSIIGSGTVAQTRKVTVLTRNAAGAAAPMTFQLGILPLPSSMTGAYTGVIGHRSGHPGTLHGLVRFQVTPACKASGVFLLEGKSYPFSTALEAAPGVTEATLSISLMQNKRPWLACHLLLSTERICHAGTFSLAGDESPPLPVSFVRNDWSAATPAPQAGRLNLATQAAPDVIENPSLPHGTGFFNLILSRAGTVAWTGRLPDGATVTGSSLISGDGCIPLGQFLYANNTGAFIAMAACTDQMAEGDLTWMKAPQPASSANASYKAGIPAHDLRLAGGRYDPPATLFTIPDGLLGDEGQIAITFSQGGLPDDQVRVFRMAQRKSAPVAVTGGRFLSFTPPAYPAFAGLPPNADNIQFTLTPATGLFQGTFTLMSPNPGSPGLAIKRVVPFFGNLVPYLSPSSTSAPLGVGCFLLPAANAAGPSAAVSPAPILSGSVLMEPAVITAP